MLSMMVQLSNPDGITISLRYLKGDSCEITVYSISGWNGLLEYIPRPMGFLAILT